MKRSPFVRRPNLIVTTSLKPTEAMELHARQQAAAWGLPYVPRGRLSIPALLPTDGAALVFARDGLHIATGHGRLTHHLGTAYIRLKSLERGHGDPLVRAGELTAGDTVIDTTFGLGRDSAVAALAIGVTGAIHAVEVSDALFHLANSQTPSPHYRADAAPVSVHHADAIAYLAQQPDGSADVVLVDPMFISPKNSDPGFAVLRAVADYTPLSQEWVHHARRVARRWAVIKVDSPQRWFEAESLARVPGNSKSPWYRSPARPR